MGRFLADPFRDPSELYTDAVGWFLTWFCAAGPALILGFAFGSAIGALMNPAIPPTNRNRPILGAFFGALLASASIAAVIYLLSWRPSPYPEVAGRDSDWHCDALPQGFTAHDLEGTWRLADWVHGIDDILTIRQDGYYQQSIQMRGEPPYTSPWQDWSIEHRDNGGIYLHLERMRYCSAIQGQTVFTCPDATDHLLYDHCERRQVPMRGEVVMSVVGTSETMTPFLANASRGIALMSMPTSPESTTDYFVLSEQYQPPPFPGNALSLVYPEGWEARELSGANQLYRLVDGSNHVKLAIQGHSLEDPDGPRTASENDQQLWDTVLVIYAQSGNQDAVEMISLEDVQIGGQPAVRRIYRAPGIADPSRSLYWMKITVIFNGNVYFIEASAPSQEAFERQDVTDLLESIRFSP